jgi:ATP-dependent helicase/nuclease subunit A
MTDPRVFSVLQAFEELNDSQRAAVAKRGCDVVVTAGAGSGKTKTLVARYTSLLSEGITPRRIAAITFTKKAALEMRSRVREALIKMQTMDGAEKDFQKWADLSAQMDAARIGTIHSLCTEILRAHPAEAGIDPRFEVLDEGLGKVYKIQAVDETLKSLVTQEYYLPLLQNIKISDLKDMLDTLLDHRLESIETFPVNINNRERLTSELKNRMGKPVFQDLIGELREMTSSEMIADGGEILANILTDIEQLWSGAETALQSGDPIECAISLFNIRRNQLTRRGGKKDSLTKDIFIQLKYNFDIYLNPITYGKDSKDDPPSKDAEALFEQLYPLLQKAFEEVHKAYQDLVENEQALDFDDIEYKAQQLLKRPEICTRWRRELDAVLVDEFQDTNHRQQEIIKALTGAPGRLFIVGDPRQSIYRFRNADVTVFREEEARITREIGLLKELDVTYRAHAPLLDATGELLDGVINKPRESMPDYYIPYTSMLADRKEPHEGFISPHIEFVLGVGDDADSARPLMAKALAARLLELKAENQIKKWEDVALLFRASTGFPFYEEAFEEAGIPFVTVAGKGFYDRPEIRDLVNILRALADPMDDLAFAGLLRSPAFGLSDAALFLLRQEGQPYWTALQGDLSILSEADRTAAKHTRDLILSLLPLVNRIPVSELLKQVVDTLDFRAILATIDSNEDDPNAKASGGRLWRNVDKLLSDAQATRQVNVRSFLDMLEVLNDAGAREGEAPAEADGSVVLMTIHKSKGLEFPIVVLADAGRQRRNTSESVYLFKNIGVTFKLEHTPMLYRLAKALDKDQNSCEDLRLLYVALTRTKSKLLISTHCKMNNKGEIKQEQWAKDLVEVAGVQSEDLLNAKGKPFEFQMANSHPLKIWCVRPEIPIPVISRSMEEKKPVKQSDFLPLYQPVAGFENEELDNEKREAWHLTKDENFVPGWIIGNMVHKGIQLWLFPENPELTDLLKVEVYKAGLISKNQRHTAMQKSIDLLERLYNHSIWEEINMAQERYSELPYTYQLDGKIETGYIDLLYRSQKGWQIVDFKTDSIRRDEERADLIGKYAPQMRRYANAVETMMSKKAQTRICFLDNQGKVELVEI